jgi:hypothetical protein
MVPVNHAMGLSVGAVGFVLFDQLLFELMAHVHG